MDTSLPLKLVLIEDSDADAALILAELSSAGVAVDTERAATRGQVRAALTRRDAADAVLCGYRGKGVNVRQALAVMASTRTTAPLIVVSRGLTDEQAAECMRLGATDYIVMDRLGRLPQAVTQAVEHSRLERDRREVEHSYRDLFENIPMAVFRATAEGTILHANAAAVGVFGYPDLESFLATSAFDLYVDPRDRTTVLDRLKSEGHLLDFECPMRRADGSVFWFSRAIHAVRQDPDRIFVWETIGRDISERKEAERELVKSQERLRSLLAGTPVAMITLDREGCVTYAGGSVFAQFGVDPASIVGTVLTEAFPERTDLLALCDEALTSELQTDLQWEGRTLHVRCGPFRVPPDGEIIGIRGVAFDTTDRVDAEHRLSRRVEQQAILLEMSRAGLEGTETATFLAASVGSVARGVETPLATILERRPSDGHLVRVASHGLSLDTPSDHAGSAASDLIDDALKTQSPVLTFDYVANPDIPQSGWMIDAGIVASMAVGIAGPVKPYGVLAVHSTVPRVFDDDDIQFIHSASTIISVAVERKRGEKQRQLLLGRVVSAQEAERKTIAEDIHDDAVQVMTAANMRLELFRMALTDPGEVAAAAKLQEVISLAIGRLRNLLFELIPPDLDRHGLVAACKRHLAQFEGIAGPRWIVRNELDVEPSPQVQILLFRIFQEAVMNVRKHAEATRATVSLKSSDGGVLMSVSDHGVGFDASAVDPVAGHLGLAAMRERAEVAGGWWRLTSERGHGTQIATWVPAPANAAVAETRMVEALAIG
ncbi:MAG: hypothetical protein QOE92_1318 [Chloroflexota bacterium]|jgi:PAS domain S-box-containing protein|nr:hypothetical protein [Chloroflexota bacterium]